MFQSQCQEGSQGEIKIDAEPAALKAFLDMLVLGEPAGNRTVKEVALDVFVLADKYNVWSLKDLCVPHIAGGIDRENCLDVLVTAYLHEHQGLMDAAFKVIKANKDRLTGSAEWRQMVSAYPMLINELLMKLLDADVAKVHAPQQSPKVQSSTVLHGLGRMRRE